MARRLCGSLLVALALSLALVTPCLATWPVAGPSYVSQWYSYRHKAIDIAARCGTTEISPVAGTVVFRGWKNNGGGYQVWIRIAGYSNRYVGLYHMRSFPPVWVGQHVYRGTRVGYVGSTGWSTGCHVHVNEWIGWPFAYRSYLVNPWPLLYGGYWMPSRYR